ncbi:hypothetical protein OQA88_5751 [Cercophora sp. LCS_1]
MRASILFTFTLLQLLAHGRKHIKSPLAGNCTMCGFADQHRLQVNCFGDPTTNITSELDLRDCVGNKNGTLVLGDKGNYTDSCQRCRMSDSFVLDCRCEEESGWALDYTNLDLGKYLDVAGGYITCLHKTHNSEDHICGQ